MTTALRTTWPSEAERTKMQSNRDFDSDLDNSSYCVFVDKPKTRRIESLVPADFSLMDYHSSLYRDIINYSTALPYHMAYPRCDLSSKLSSAMSSFRESHSESDASMSGEIAFKLRPLLK
jgi:hypothetical protein